MDRKLCVVAIAVAVLGLLVAAGMPGDQVWLSAPSGALLGTMLGQISVGAVK